MCWLGLVYGKLLGPVWFKGVVGVHGGCARFNLGQAQGSSQQEGAMVYAKWGKQPHLLVIYSIIYISIATVATIDCSLYCV